MLTIAGLLLLVLLAWRSRASLAQVLDNVRPPLFLAAVVAGVALTVVQGLYFRCLMAKNGSGSAGRAVVVAFLLAQPGKYVPGKIWGPLMQKASLGAGSSLVVIAASNLELALLVMLQMLCLGIACLTITQAWLATLFVAIGVGTGALILRIGLLGPMHAAMPRLAARLGVTGPPARGQRPGPAAALTLSAAVLALTMLASWQVLAAMGIGGSPRAQAEILGTLFLGFSSSLLVFPVPAGLGVREAATAMIGRLTAPDVTAALLVSVALVARAWQMAVDLACLLLGLALDVRRAGPPR